jgi:hypothetical protein
MSSEFSSFDKDKKIFDGWRQFLNESAAPGMAVLDEDENLEEQDAGAGTRHGTYADRMDRQKARAAKKEETGYGFNTAHSIERTQPGMGGLSHINIGGQKLAMDSLAALGQQADTPFADEKTMIDSGLLDASTNQLTDAGLRHYNRWNTDRIKNATILKHADTGPVSPTNVVDALASAPVSTGTPEEQIVNEVYERIIKKLKI